MGKMKEGKANVELRVWLDKDMHTKLKVRSAKEGRPGKEIIYNSVSSYLYEGDESSNGS